MTSQVHAFWNPNSPPPHHPAVGLAVAFQTGVWVGSFGPVGTQQGIPEIDSRLLQRIKLQRHKHIFRPQISPWCLLCCVPAVWALGASSLVLSWTVILNTLLPVPCLGCILFQPELHTAVGITERSNSLSMLFPSTPVTLCPQSPV